MFDLKAIRDNPAWFDGGMQRRGIADQFSSKAVLDLDEKRRKLVTDLQELQGRRNSASKEIGKAMGAKDTALAEKLKAEVAGLKDQIAAGEAEQAKIDKAIEDYLAVIPNIPLDAVPDGKDEKDNVEVRKSGEPNALIKAAGVNKPKQHFELGEALGMMDFETAAKVSGARFVFLKGQLARLERALAQFMLDAHTAPEKDGVGGYTEVNPPLLVRDAAAYGTANLPKFAADLFPSSREPTLRERVRQFYRQAPPSEWPDQNAFDQKPTTDEFKDDWLRERAVSEQDFLAKWMPEFAYQHALAEESNRLWLIPTAEVSLTNLAREQIIDEEKLPWRFTAATPCFRSEAGAAGRDTRGMIRQHQFTKVEMVSITSADQSLAEHERMTKCAETILQRLGLPFRTIVLCTGDMGFASQKTYDIEVWLPGQDAYREISSCSVCGDFQARRMGARYRVKGGKDVRYVHTLNGSGLAVGRTLIAVMENYQQADGSIVVPEALRPYMGGIEKIAAAGK